MSSDNVFLISGATGYIGSRLVEMLLSEGSRVVTIGRTPPASSCSGVEHHTWSMEEPLPDGIIEAGFRVIHLAHVWNTNGDGPGDINFDGTRRLLDACRRAGVERIIFASSVSARPEALNRYGRLKARIEDELLAPSDVSARIGLIYGGSCRGQWGTLVNMAKLPVTPMIDPGTKVQPIHLDDVCSGLISLANLPEPRRSVYPLCSTEPVTLGGFLKCISVNKQGKPLILVPVPSRLALLAVDIVRKFPGLPRIDRERILGAIGLPLLNSAEALDELSLNLRLLEEGMRPDMRERRRQLLEEGRVLLRTVTGKYPRPYEIRRYVRAVMRQSDMQEAHVPCRLHPILVAAQEPLKGEDTPLARRFDIAAKIGETISVATPNHPAGVGKFQLFGVLAKIVSREAGLLPFRLAMFAMRR